MTYDTRWGPEHIVRAAPLGKLSVRRIRINGGGYDSTGSYWGLGQPLYQADLPNGETEAFRAVDRAAALAIAATL